MVTSVSKQWFAATCMNGLDTALLAVASATRRARDNSKNFVSGELVELADAVAQLSPLLEIARQRVEESNTRESGS